VATSAARSYPRQADVLRAVEAARRVGICVNSVEIRPDGTIKVSQVTEAARDEFERWEGTL
jgi:hypothetical protein